jgi:hypothetical protein
LMYPYFPDTPRNSNVALSSLVSLLHLNARRDWKHVFTISINKAPHICYHAHLSVGTSLSAKEAQLATCELGHLHWAGHCPMTPSITDTISKNTNSKYNIILCYISKCTLSCEICGRHRCNCRFSFSGWLLRHSC